jgi:hypothetical protein
MDASSKWAVVQIEWDDEHKSLCCSNPETFAFCKSSYEALIAAKGAIESGAKMAAVLEVKHLFRAKAEIVT